MNKKALSPLIATVLLVAFALVIGTITMKWGENYVDEINEQGKEEIKTGSVILNYQDIDTPLKKLQLDFLAGKYSQEEYLQKERELFGQTG